MWSCVVITSIYGCRNSSYLNEGLSVINVHNPTILILAVFSTIIKAKLLQSLKYKCLDSVHGAVRQGEIPSV